MMERKLVQLFRVLIAALFLFSGISKLLSLAFFDGLLAELFIGDDYFNYPDAVWWTQVFSRVIISGEIVLGIAVMQPKWLKTVVLPVIMLMLVAFNIHLTYVGLEVGFIDGNCGCFGDILPMNNLESIIKNLVTMLIVGYVWWKFKDDREYFVFRPIVIPILAGVVTFGSLSLTIKNYDKPANPIQEFNSSDFIDPNGASLPDGNNDSVIDSVKTDSSEMPPKGEGEVNSFSGSRSPEKDPEIESKEIKEVATGKADQPKETVKVVETKATTLFSSYTELADGSSVNLDEGKKMICMYSLTCGHCQESYKDLCQIANNPNTPPIYLIVYGSEFDLGYFFNQAGCKHPYILIKDYDEFKRLLEGQSFPKVDIRENGKTLKSWNLQTYSINKVKDYLGISYDKPKEVKDPNEIEIESGNGGFGW